MGQSQSVPSISNGSPSDSKKSLSDSKKRSSTSSNSSLSGLDGLEPTLPIELQVLIQGNALVEHLAIYKSPLNDQKALTHHFLIIRLCHIERMTTVRYIKAEKRINTDTGRGMISITCGIEEFDRGKSLLKDGLPIPLGCGTIPLQKLIDILKAPNPGYNVLVRNCWVYADETFRQLIKACSNLPETTSKAKQSLQSYLADLPCRQLIKMFLKRYRQLLRQAVAVLALNPLNVCASVAGVLGLYCVYYSTLKEIGVNGNIEFLEWVVCTVFRTS
ncbi:unnamed protein product [Calypogeia fissa]